MSRFVRTGTTVAIAVCTSCLWSQKGAHPPVYRVTVMERGITAIHYQYGGAPTKVDFRGTAVLPDAKGEAAVQSRRERIDVDAKFEKLTPPMQFGREYLAYVLWAISPDGSWYNLGEVIPEASQRARLRVTTDLPAFGMMVTAEPYATVRRPSTVVVLENHVRPDTEGQVQRIQAKGDLVPRGSYGWQGPENPPGPKGPKVSIGRYEALLHLYQAQNAVGIAQLEKADLHAPDAFAAARRALSEAQHLIATKANDKLVVQYAREAEEHAEDARLIAERSKQEDQRAVVERASPEPAAAPTEARLPNQADREVREPGIHTQLLQRLDGSLPAQDMPESVLITLPDNSFDGAKLSAGVAEKLASIAAMLASHRSVRVNIQAYTDAGASELQSWERAQAVRNRLVEFGVAANQITFRGMSVQANQRVEIVISGAQ
jgi:outer membrane protein OmpA-like peptidoglycan-associated protein